MTEPYDLRSNIKGKPGSQGTLFQVKDKGLLNPQQRWPRGYGPERQGEIRGALDKVDVKGQAHNLFEEQDRAQLTHVIAKSTIPASDLHGLTEIHGRPAEGTQATYWPQARKIGVDLSHQDADRDLVHEIGHHVDQMHGLRDAPLRGATVKNAVADRSTRGVDGAPTSTDLAYARDRVSYGVREAVADNYYVKHYKTGGRKPQGAEQGRYEDNFTPETLDKKYPGYSDVRPQPGFSNLNNMQFQGKLF